MQITLRRPRIVIPLTYDLQGFRVWCTIAALAGLKWVAVLAGVGDRLVAAAIANRLWPLFVVALYLRETISLLSRPNIYIFVLALYGVLGVLSGNVFVDVVTDAAVMFLPAIFWRSLCDAEINTPERYAEFLNTYFKLNVLGMFVVTLPGMAFGGGAGMDWNFLIPVFLTRIFTSHIFMDSALYGILFIVAAALSLNSKTALGNIAIAAISLTRGRLRYILAGGFLAAIAVLISLPFIFETTAGTKLSLVMNNINLSGLMNLPLSNLVFNPILIFSFLDISSGERIFELLQALNKINQDWFHFLFGFGLGGGIDVSGTMDKSVLRAHSGDTEDVRVVHLAVTFFLLKGGIIGLTAYLVSSTWAMWNAIQNIRLLMIFRDYRWVWFGNVSALLIWFSMQFAIANYVKLPLIAISLMAIFIGRELRADYRRRKSARSYSEDHVTS
jgi:hypothetical protein